MRKADLTSPVLLWFTTIIAAVVIVVWFVQSAGINRFDVRSIDEDLKNVRYELSLACSYASFETRLNLHTKSGELSINSSRTCIIQGMTNNNITRCLPTPCTVQETTIDLYENPTASIKKEKGIISIE